MRKKYATKAFGAIYSEWGDIANTAQVVFDTDKDPYFSGLYGPDGQPIYCFYETVPFGFQGNG